MALPASAKEVMTLLNGEEIEVEIVTLGTNDISYKKASNPDGPTYTTPPRQGILHSLRGWHQRNHHSAQRPYNHNPTRSGAATSLYRRV